MIRRINSVFQSTFYTAVVVLCALFVNIKVNAQTEDNVKVHEIKGVVIDAQSKEPVAAVQVKTLNAKYSALTNAKGEFSIKVEDYTDVLYVSAINYNSIEVPIRGRDEISVELYSNKFKPSYSKQLTGKKVKRSTVVTRSVSQLDDLNRPTSVTADMEIQGQVGGDVRTISQSGVQGAGSTMYIRGLNSIYRNAQPLIVVDGVIWKRNTEISSLIDGYSSNPLLDIANSDIASISIIKDGTSLWGAKGANGVILIDTKHAHDMATKIDVNATVGILQQAKSLPVMDADQYRLYASDMVSTMSDDQLLDMFQTKNIEKINFLQENKALKTYGVYHNNTDWDDEVYKSGMYHDYDINVTGGDDRALYAFSVGYSKTDDVESEIDMKHFHTRFNADINLYDNIDLGFYMGYTNTDKNLVDDGVSYYSSPSYLAMIKSPFLSPYRYSALGELTSAYAYEDDFGISNPSGILNSNYNINRRYRFNVGLKPQFHINDKFVFTDMFDYSFWREEESYFRPMDPVIDTYLDGFGVVENVMANQVIRNSCIFNDATLRYSDTFSKYHHLKAYLGWRYIVNNMERDYEEGYNSGSDDVRFLTDALVYKSAKGVNNDTRNISTYINADYNYDNRYFVNVTASVDGSSTFGKETEGGFKLFDHNWAFFPSVELGWLASSETFMKDVDFINMLKLRAGISLSGNDDIPPLSNQSYFSSVRYMSYATGLVLSGIANNEIQWETSTKMNFGLDASLFNNRLGLTADIYHDKVGNLLYYKELPEEVGTGYYWSNSGEMTNNGVELALDVKVLNSKTLKWDLGLTVGHYKNEITEIPEEGMKPLEVCGANIATIKGEAAGVFYGYQTDGVYATTNEASGANLSIIDENGDRQYFAAGDVKFKNLNGDDVIDENDMTIIGDPNPDFYGSLNTKLSYGRFTLDAIFNFSYGNDAYNYLRAQLESGSDFKNQSTAMLGHWSYEGQQTSMPAIAYGDPMGNARFSDRWIEDASYFKMKKLSLSYDVPVGDIPVIEGLKIWVAANNLFTLTEYLGRDPEFSMNSHVLYQGIDAGLLPSTRSYFVGVKINL